MNIYEVLACGDVAHSDGVLQVIVTSEPRPLNSAVTVFRVWRQTKEGYFEHARIFMSETTDPKGAARDWLQANKSDL